MDQSTERPDRKPPLVRGFGSRDYRSVVGLFTTGVAVIAVRTGAEPVGMTVNSFTSVSLEPPLILVCLDKRSQFLELVRLERAFGLSFLAADQEQISRRFARQPYEGTLEEPIFFPEGPPLLCRAAGGLECELTQEVEAGDHTILIARVASIFRTEGETGSLLYHRGGYRALT